jgi:hypothetical protein
VVSVDGVVEVEEGIVGGRSSGKFGWRGAFCAERDRPRWCRLAGLI